MYYITHKDNENLYWDKKKKRWLDEETALNDDNYDITHFKREPSESQIPADGVLNEFDEHITCANYPNCDMFGCGSY